MCSPIYNDQANLEPRDRRVLAKLAKVLWSFTFRGVLEAQTGVTGGPHACTNRSDLGLEQENFLSLNFYLNMFSRPKITRWIRIR